MRPLRWPATVAAWADPPIASPGVRLARHRGTTAHVASIYPFHGGHALADVAAPYVGVNVTDGGSAWCYDPFELYGRRPRRRDDPDQLEHVGARRTGQRQVERSKTMLWRQAGYYGTRRFIAISDPKGEYGPLSAALGMPTRQAAARRPRPAQPARPRTR